jgi:hypothetical protein
MPEDRPSQEIINDDEKFDAWAEAYERKMAQKTTTMHKVQSNKSEVIRPDPESVYDN